MNLSSTLSVLGLIVYKIDFQITMTMRLARKKFDKFLQDGHTRILTWEVSQGFSWRRTSEDRSPFEEGLANFIRDLQTLTRRDPMPDVPVAVPVVHPYVDTIFVG
ncbi:hypothetical protein SUGI_0696620 [Cryptomeria japonica]|nr:hypothetical protein SUGI_0696620 [Cryptomeria japonica]